MDGVDQSSGTTNIIARFSVRPKLTEDTKKMHVPMFCCRRVKKGCHSLKWLRVAEK